ncbi:hypothetical protein [Nocardia mikamii]|uniref:hypothetical protein n=1 Tax=Nocardia mikamii TaxID=508464 RepID=UPI0012F49F4E|nr:hypothetical protein [Nocardia mikamii]
MAHRVDEVVDLAGGWLFDRVMAGCDVTVLIAHPHDPVPLRMLGADVVDLATVPPSSHGATPRELAVIGDERTFDDAVRRWITRSLDTGDPETTLWGDTHDPDLIRHTEQAQHRASLAALAFKSRAHALAARRTGAVDDTPVSGIESFRAVGGARSVPASTGRIRDNRRAISPPPPERTRQ